LHAEEGGFLSNKGMEFNLAGELEFEFVAAGDSALISDPYFTVDKFVLQPKVKVGDNLELDAQLYFTAVNAYLNEAHAKFSGLGWNSWIDAGLYERWLKSQHGRKTEGYSILGSAFYRDDGYTVTWGADVKPVYWMVSVGNGYRLGAKQVGEDAAAKSRVLHDDSSLPALSSHAFEYGVNLGVKTPIGDAGKMDLMGFYYTDELSDLGVAYLVAAMPGYVSDKTDKTRIGGGAKFTFGPARLYGAYITATDGDLERASWLLEGLYNFKAGGDRAWFQGVTFVASYCDYTVDNDKSFDKPLSWDRDQVIVAGIVDVVKGAKLKLEYYINGEDFGSSDARADQEWENDEFLAQLEVKF
jgi:hypothetical protein